MTTARRAVPFLLALAALVAVFVGCDGSLPGLCEDGNCRTQAWSQRTLQSFVDPKLDLLIVVDDTSAIAPHLDALAAGFADMAQQLQGPGPKISLHVGFIRSGGCDARTRGATCGLAASEEFVRSEWCQTISNLNYPSDLSGAFVCLGDFGGDDCGPAQPLAAAVRTLAGPPLPGWAGFVRPDAMLMILVVGATDDASGAAGSLAPVADLVAAVRALKPDSSYILAAVIGPGGNCTAGGEPGPRLMEFVNAFGANGLYYPLCAEHLGVALSRATTSINVDLQRPCFTSVRDTDPDAPGLQAECAAQDHVRGPDGTWTTGTLPSCDAAAPPCWRLLPAAGYNCDYFVTVDRGADWCEAAATSTTIECLACADANDPACRPQP